MKKLMAVLLLSGSVMISKGLKSDKGPEDLVMFFLYGLEVTENVIGDNQDPKVLAKRIRAQIKNLELSQAAARLKECIELSKENSTNVKCGHLFDVYNQLKTSYVNDVLPIQEQVQPSEK